MAVTLQTEDQEAIIRSGDYIIGDLNGVVCLPKELAEQTIALIGEQVEADVKMAKAIQKGMKFVDASKKYRAVKQKA